MGCENKGPSGAEDTNANCNSTSKVASWRDNFKGWPYAENATSFDDVEADIARDRDGARGESKLQWDKVRSAMRDAWAHVGNG